MGCYPLARWTVVATFGLALGLAGCGSSSKSEATSTVPPAATPGSVSSTSASPPTTTAGATDACSLLSEAQVSAAYGTTVHHIAQSAPGGGSGCNYDDTPGHHRLLVTVYAGSQYFSPSQQMTSPQSVTGPWDKAALDASTGEVEYVAKDRTVTITDLTVTLSTAELTQLATQSTAGL